MTDLPLAPVPDLDSDTRARFERDGFLVLERLIPEAACDRLRAAADALVAALDPTTVQSVFSSRNQDATTDDYFLDSADKVHFFFEEEAFDEDGGLHRPKELSINKIGHALHDRDPLFAAFSRQGAFRAIVQALGLERPLLMQSMYIFKQPHIGGEVLPHQDATFLYTDPVSVVVLWVALEDADRTNGCLFALPGGHRAGLKARFRAPPGRRGGHGRARSSPPGRPRAACLWRCRRAWWWSCTGFCPVAARPTEPTDRAMRIPCIWSMDPAPIPRTTGCNVRQTIRPVGSTCRPSRD